VISYLFKVVIDEDRWYVESGASKHMTGSQEVFKTLTEWDLEVSHGVGR